MSEPTQETAGRVVVVGPDGQPVGEVAMPSDADAQDHPVTALWDPEDPLGQ